MRLGIMQPYFFPYIGYFSLIKHTDLFILFDTVQFIRHGWIERNRILKPGNNNEWQYIQIPLVKHARETLIKDILINNTTDWKSKIIAQLQHYKKKAPFYKEVLDLLNEIFSFDFNDIVSFNYKSLKIVCTYLNIHTQISVFSKMNLDIEEVNAPDEWALNICKAIPNANEYWNPIGGTTFFDPEKYSKNNINIKFQQVESSSYNQLGTDAFIPFLSIIDVMMFNSSEEINSMVDNYKLL